MTNFSAGQRGRLVVLAGGALASLALHALLLAPLILGGTMHDKAHDPDDIGTSTVASDGAIVVELIEDTADSMEAAGRQEPALDSPTGFSRQLLAELRAAASIPDTEAETESAPKAAQTPGNASEFAALYGRYLGQVSARIERAWMRPRAPIGSDVFSCRVRVLQDRSGEVLDIFLAQCNGSQRWRASLVQAIRAAAPLSAPPDPRVFTERVVLEFRSLPYVEGGTSEGFEPSTLTATTEVFPTSPPPPSTGSSELANRLHVLKSAQPIIGH
jgi:hypothetical protein